MTPTPRSPPLPDRCRGGPRTPPSSPRRVSGGFAVSGWKGVSACGRRVRVETVSDRAGFQTFPSAATVSCRSRRRPGGPTLRAAFIATALSSAIVGTWGCDDDGVIVCVDAASPSSFGRIEVSVALARPDGVVCATAAPASVSRPADLPLCIGVAPDPPWTAGVVVHAAGFDPAGEHRASGRVHVEFVDGELVRSSLVLSDGCPSQCCTTGDCAATPEHPFDQLEVDPDCTVPPPS